MATVLVTGANRGIGLALCKVFHDRGDQVIGVCRKSSAPLEALGVRVEAGIDVADQASVDALGERVGDTPIDILINNAGILTRENLDDLDFDRIRKEIEVNALGPLRVTTRLLPRLHKGSRVGMITSLMGSMGDNGSGGMYGYRMSKAALNSASVSLARDLAARGIAVIVFHPGYVKTDMTRHQGTVEPAQSAAGIVQRLDELTVDTTGRFVRWDGQPLPW